MVLSWECMQIELLQSATLTIWHEAICLSQLCTTKVEHSMVMNVSNSVMPCVNSFLQDAGHVLAWPGCIW